MQRPFKVLFLSTGNSARSIFAEALTARYGSGKFDAHSAGLRPAGRVHPLALELLKFRGCDIRRLRSKSLLEFCGADAPAMDFIFTVSDEAAGEEPPIWPGAALTANWLVADPNALAASGRTEAEAVQTAYQKILKLVLLLCRISPGTLDRMALTWKPDEIRTEEIPPHLRPERKAVRDERTRALTGGNRS